MSFGRRLQHLLSFCELLYFNAKVRYHCSLDIFHTVKEISVGGRNYVEKNSSFMFNPISTGGGVFHPMPSKWLRTPQRNKLAP